MNARRIMGVALLLSALLGLVWLLRPAPTATWPEPPRPAGDAALDPALRERIEATLAELDAEPGQVAHRARLGMIYEAGGLYELAVATYEQLVARDEAAAAESELRYRLARSLERSGRLEDAISALRGAVEQLDAPGWPHELLVDWLLQAGRTADAARWVEEIGGEPPRLPLAKARVWVVQGQLDAAHALLTESGLLDGAQARPALFLLAQVQRRRGETDAARATAERAQAADPPPPHPWDIGMASHRVGVSSLRQQARGQIERGDLADALDTLQTLRDQPGGDDPRIASMMAQVYLQQGRFDLAVELLERTLELHPDDYLSHLNLAKSISLSVAQGASPVHLDRALAAADEALRLRPDAADAWSTRGQVLEAGGRVDEALTAYEASWQRDERDPTARVRAAFLHLERGAFATAREVLLPVTGSRGSAPTALLGRARAEAELGDLETARTLLSWIGERLPAEQLEPLRARLTAAE